MTTPRSTAAMVAHAKKRYADTERKIAKAIKDMRRKGLTINPQTVAKHAGVSRKTVYIHHGLFDQIRAETTTPTLNTAPPAAEPATESTITAALRDQLRLHKQRHQSEIAELKAEKQSPRTSPRHRTRRTPPAPQQPNHQRRPTSVTPLQITLFPTAKTSQNDTWVTVLHAP